MNNIIIKLQEWAMLYGIRIIAAIVILIAGYWMARVIKKLLWKIMLKSNVDKTLISFTSSVTYVALITFVVIAALGQLGIQTASFIAVIGATGLAIGLALQGSLANFAAGVLLIIFKPFKVGDFIEGAGTLGGVEEIGIFTTVLNSPDNKKIIIPNAKMTSDNIINYTAKENRRLEIVVGVSYNDNLDKVKDILENILSRDKRILKDPAPIVGVTELADSSVNFVVRPWVKISDYWNVFSDTQKTIKERFDAEGITIPFPQRDVHVYRKKL